MPDPGAKKQPTAKQLNRELRNARKKANTRIFDRPEVKAAQKALREADKEVNKATRAVKQAQKELKKTPKPSKAALRDVPRKTIFQRLFTGSRGGGGGGGVGGFEFDKISGKLRRRKILQ